MSHTAFYTFDNARLLVEDAVVYIMGEDLNDNAANLKIHIRLENEQMVYIDVHEDYMYVDLRHTDDSNRILQSIQLDVETKMVTKQVMNILERHGYGILHIQIIHNDTSFYVLPPIEPTNRACVVCQKSMADTDAVCMWSAQAKTSLHRRALSHCDCMSDPDRRLVIRGPWNRATGMCKSCGSTLHNVHNYEHTDEKQ